MGCLNYVDAWDSSSSIDHDMGPCWTSEYIYMPRLVYSWSTSNQGQAQMKYVNRVDPLPLNIKTECSR